MTLADLTAVLDIICGGGDHNIHLTGLHYDSRQVRPGFLFVAIKGYQTDGHLFVNDALERGAVAVITEQELPLPPHIAWVRVQNSRRALAQLAARYYNHPSHHLRLLGITGTNGKTTTAYLIKSVLEAAGMRTGLLGTLGNYMGKRLIKAGLTTPESLDLQFILHDMLNHGAQAAVMEVSSHALALHRVEGAEFAAAVFTNLSQDHLDFHRDMEHYFNSKVQLFTNLKQREQRKSPYAVINGDDPYGQRMAQLISVPVITYGCNSNCQVKVRDINLAPKGTSCEVIWPGGAKKLKLRLTGMFNIYNFLAAFAAALQEGIDPELIADTLTQVEGVPGRFEQVHQGQPYAVVIDYAHTPDGLENILQAVRQITTGRLLVVFGCGGDRDKSKRPLMGRAVARLSDYSIITSDNPRSEDPQTIIEDIIPGFKDVPGAAYEHLVDRRQAIAAALNMARPGDAIVIAGKGHETYQIIKDKTLPFDDRQVVREELAAQGYIGE